MSQPRRRRDNLIYALSGTAWPYCLSMSAALPENMRGLALSAMVIKLASLLRADRQDACLRRCGNTRVLKRRRLVAGEGSDNLLSARRCVSNA